MLRSSFFSLGLFIALWGVTFLFVDQVVLRVDGNGDQRSPGFRGLFTSADSKQQKIVDPPDWAAFSLLSIGTVTMLYAVALPRAAGDS